MTFAPGIPDYDIGALDLLQRVLVTTDGTVTDVLCVAFREPIDLVKLHVAIVTTTDPIDALGLEAGATLMRRRIVLRGASTRRPYAYAEVAIAADRLAPGLRQDLLDGRVPLGELWQAHRLETWKERPRVRERAAGHLGAVLELDATDVLIERVYRTFTGGQPVFEVREFFPRRYAERPS